MIGHDTYQTIRMIFIWPLIVSALAWWLTFLVTERLRSVPRRTNVQLALTTAACAGVIAANISRSWNGGRDYWLVFTIGLLGAAAVLWISVGWVATDRVNIR